MDGDDEPSSLVKPPPDMLSGTGSRLGSAWARGEESAAAVEEAPAPALEETTIDLGDADADAAAPPLYGLEAFDAGDLPPLEGDEIVLDLDADLPPLDSSIWAIEMEPAPAPSPSREVAPPTGGIDHDLLERTAAEVQPEALARDEVLVSEAEVLAKYGLEEKALERLDEALRIRPQNLGAHAARVQIQLDKGRLDRVVELANAFSRAAAEAHDTVVWPKMRRQLIEAGFRLDGERVVADPHAAVAPPPAPPPTKVAAPAAPEPDFDLDLDLSELATLSPAPEASLPSPPPAPPPPPAAAPAAEAAPASVAPAARKRSSGEIDRELRGLLEPKAKRPAAPRPSPPVGRPGARGRGRRGRVRSRRLRRRRSGPNRRLRRQRLHPLQYQPGR